jgi:hypothetical protein
LVRSYSGFWRSYDPLYHFCGFCNIPSGGLTLVVWTEK